jgi:hypothetical protein
VEVLFYRTSILVEHPSFIRLKIKQNCLATTVDSVKNIFDATFRTHSKLEGHRGFVRGNGTASYSETQIKYMTFNQLIKYSRFVEFYGRDRICKQDRRLFLTTLVYLRGRVAFIHALWYYYF